MKLQAFLLCDDIRREITNKLVFVGVYDFNISFPAEVKWPIAIPMAFFCRFKLEEGDKPFDEVDLNFYLDGVSIVQGNFRITVKDYSKTITIFDKIPKFVIPKSGSLTCEFVLKSKGEQVGKIKPDFPLAVQAGLPR